MGIKGAGEAGSIGATPAVMNAVIDALWRGRGIRHLEMPATPQRVWQAIADAKQRMSADTGDRREHRPLLGIALKVGAVFCFITMFTFVKLAGQVPPGQIVFFRSFFALIPVLIWVFARGHGLAAFKTDDFAGHLWRGIIGVTSMGLGFFGLTQLPLPEAVAIGYAMPLITVVMGAVLLKEQVRAYRWTAVLVGLVGVMIVSWPRLSIFADPDAASVERSVGCDGGSRLRRICRRRDDPDPPPDQPGSAPSPSSSISR